MEGLKAKAGVVSAAMAMLGFQIVPAKLRTTAKSWGQNPLGYTNEDYQLFVHDKDWRQLKVPVVYAKSVNIETSFRYLNVYLVSNIRYIKQHDLPVRQAADAAMQKQARRMSIWRSNYHHTARLHSQEI